MDPDAQAEAVILRLLKDREMPPREVIPLASKEAKGYRVREAYWRLRSTYQIVQDPQGLLRVA